MIISIEKLIINNQITKEDKEQELIAIIKDTPVLKQQLISYRQIDDTHYYVNGLGNIIKVTPTKNGFKSRPIKQATLKPKGYKYFKINKKTVYVHRAVGKAFLGLLKEEQINHMDKNTDNNMIFNLERVTNNGNKKHSLKFDELVNSSGSTDIDIFKYKYDLSTIIPLEKFSGNVILYHY